MSRAKVTQARILQAATAEFAAHGLAGARVDRIAQAASANKNLIYVYFGSKEALFDAVFEAQVTQGLEAVPFTADDLPAYAGQVHDHCRKHPEVIRLTAWHRLECADRPEPATATSAYAAKLAAIETAQRDGRVSDAFPPAVLLALIVALATADSPVGATMPPSPTTWPCRDDEIRAGIVEAVRRLIALPQNR
ncbi:TetR family transcriptional regulator [Actinomadura kijaniata]|uniref:AcrR family transcriptional regulator n=1 Tax=Actinomadura namibiensis TaxID=182080 RepID=A0A7W3LZZ5_ACTNM|nr:TetR family transcriptional regulator [Actinomadura namibiensis]MBA8957441.1 AcrR family transcriptional regulator [Actinomadura namibiensis]